MSSPVHAGDAPIYQPPATWVVPAPAVDVSKLTADSPALIVFDMQQRIEAGTLWTYVDGATRITSPEMLTQAANITAAWSPDKGDLIVHELSILRGAEKIDLLAKGQKFTVLRREQMLEQLELTGILTATLAVEGLQVGDVVHFRLTTAMKDAALAGRVQSAMPLLVAPVRVGFGRVRLSWPSAEALKWRVSAEGAKPQVQTKGGITELTLALPIPKQPEVPADAPIRFRKTPIVQVSTFAGWADVSRVMAPLYATSGTIAKDSPIAAQVAAIVKSETSPRARAARALQVVQDQIRYLAVGMNGGNYVPQSPARTWEVRYGDCKAKTLLLLAMLHAMGIEAQPVLASVGLRGLVRDLLPSAGAFNHVLVNATIDGSSLWLDGTGSGARLADLGDTPPFGTVLPLKESGAELIDIATHANARPTYELTIDADESASSDLPSVFDATAVVRGPYAAQLTLSATSLAEKERRKMIGAYFQSVIGDALIADAAMSNDAEAGTVTLKARGVLTTSWENEERRRVRKLGGALEDIEFAPDRARPAWTAIPVSTPDPEGTIYRVNIKLPGGGKGYAIEGEQGLKTRIAGRDVSRTAKLSNGVMSLEERVDQTGQEIAAADIAAERDKLATAKARAPQIVEPADGRRRWELSGTDPAGATQIAAVNAVFGKAIANDPEDTNGYTSRASFRAGIGDLKGAVADLKSAIAIAPTVKLYLDRSQQYYELGNIAGALSDAEAARKIDPSSIEAISSVSQLKAERGDIPGALAILDERIALGGQTRAELIEAKAGIVGDFGDPAVAIELLDTLIAEKPGSPSLLNSRCWIKATRSVMIDTALKDCTSAIELSSNTIPALDSRALVWYRMGRFEDALRDLDAVLVAEPGLAQSRFLRGLVLQRLNRAVESERDLAIARRITPSIDKRNARYGLAA